MPSQRRAIKGFPPYTQCTEQELHESRIEPRLYACENFTLQKHTPLSLFFTKCQKNVFYPLCGSVYFWGRKCVKRKVRRRQRRAGTQQKLSVFHALPVSALCVIICCGPWARKATRMSSPCCVASPQVKNINHQKHQREEKNDDNLRKL